MIFLITQYNSSFHEAIQPVVIENVPDKKFAIAIKPVMDPDNTSDIQTTIKKIFPDSIKTAITNPEKSLRVE